MVKPANRIRNMPVEPTLKVHIHVVYLRLRTSYTKNNAVKT